MTAYCLLFATLFAATSARGEWFVAIMEGPVYPLLGTQARLMGEVKLQVVLDARGKALSVKVISGHSVLASAAVDNVKRWAFVRCGDNAPEDDRKIEITYSFRLEGSPNLRPRTSFRYDHPYKVTVIAEQQHWMPAGSAPR